MRRQSISDTANPAAAKIGCLLIVRKTLALQKAGNTGQITDIVQAFDGFGGAIHRRNNPAPRAFHFVD